MSFACLPLVFFNGKNGAQPVGGLITDSNGDLIGTTYSGGGAGDGTVFKIAVTSTGYSSTPTLIETFAGLNGANPTAGLVADAAGDLFGTTYNGGAYTGEFGQNLNFGMVFELLNNGGGSYTFTPVVSFDEATSYETWARAQSLGAQWLSTAPEPSLARTELFGDYGTVFGIAKTSTGYASTPTTLADLSSTEGQDPQGGLIRLREPCTAPPTKARRRARARCFRSRARTNLATFPSPRMAMMAQTLWRV